MQIAYFDCFSGISGDMTLAALIDAGADLASIQSAIDSMGLGAVRLSVANTQRKGFRGKLLAIEHPREHVHRNLRDIHLHIRRGHFSSRAKDLAMRFFERIARAEAKVHGTTMDRVRFHEVGAIDSIVDLVGVAIAWDSLGIGKAFASAVPTGTGMVRIAHGTVSVPAPATAELLVGVPIAPTQIPMEMTTPTGAAILTELVADFGPMPSMQVGRIGYGAGSREITDRPNLLRILIGNALGSAAIQGDRISDQIVVLECNLDDVSGEQIGFAVDRLWQAGALDVFTSSIQMKKNRPGTLLTILARPEDRQSLELILFKHTSTLGVRYRKQSRTILPRSMVDVVTPWGTVQGKVSTLPTGEKDFSPEYDDCARLAHTHGLRLADVVAKTQACYEHNLLEGRRTAASGQKIEKVNTVFLQAAYEDEFETDSSTPIEVESTNRGNSSQSLEEAILGGFTGATEAIVETASAMEAPLESEQVNEYYRWDSAPWIAERIAPLPPSKMPKEYPIRDDPSSS